MSSLIEQFVTATPDAPFPENQFPKLRKGQVILEFGKPIDPKALSRDEQKCLGVYSRGLIGRMLLEQKGIPVD